MPAADMIGATPERGAREGRLAQSVESRTMNAGMTGRRCDWRQGAAKFVLLLAAWTAGVGIAADTPKNIIILFADGAAATQWEFGRYSSRLLRKQPFVTTDVVFRQGALGLLATTPANAIVTDSAAAATAMSTGVKTNNFMLGVTPDGKPVETLMEAARKAGKRIGLITTATIYDASPAGFSVHARERGQSQLIVDQYLALEPDVLLGGGADYFVPPAQGGRRTDGRNIADAFAAKGYAIAATPAALAAARGPRLLGLFAAGDLALEIERDPAREPLLADMLGAALRILAPASPRGFVLFVESENPDSTGHLNDAAGLMRALWAFDDAVKAALDFQRANPDTLILVTGDHETGGLSVTYAQDERGRTFTAGDRELAMLEGIKGSLASAAAQLGTKPQGEALDALVAARFPGFRLDADLRDAILQQRPLERSFSYVTPSALARMISRQTGIYWGTTGHTNEPVVVGAIGPGAALFRGFQDNTDFAKSLKRLIAGDAR
jgi:alkaline phosphatase